MKTELIYSNNRAEDIDRALEEIARFRSQYAYLVRERKGRLRRLLAERRYGSLMAADADLAKLVEELTELRGLVEISNVIRDTFERYHGSMDIKVQERHGAEKQVYYELFVITDGYSDDVGKSGSVRIPGMQRSFTLSREALDKSFRRGVIDFSWLDGALYNCARRAASLRQDLRICGSEEPKALPMKKELPAVDFQDSGDNPGDILE